MDEQLLKQNTDCVYFLASPLTCKKGMECEYRHSDIARLNPRDCWYWFNANCLNSRCGFRHPPLEKHNEEAVEQVSSYQSSVSVDKTTVSCYFYYNGFCNKGDGCSFSHGFNSNVPSKTSASLPSTATGNVAPRTGRVAESAEVNTSALKTAPNIVVNLKMLSKEDPPLLSETKKLIPQGENIQVDVSPGDEGVTLKCDASPPAKNITENRSPVLSDHSPLKQVGDDIDESEERLKSSPGFDVLVDDISDNMVYEDEQENLPLEDRENREFTNISRYHFEDSLEYDPRYPDKHLHETDMYGFEDSLPVLDDENLNSGHSGSRMLDSLMSRKRKLLITHSKINGLRSIDLHERLGKRSLVDGNLFITRSPRRHASPYLRSQSRERLQRRSISKQPHQRLASEVAMNAIPSHESSRSVPNFQHNLHAGRHSLYDSHSKKLLYGGRRHADKKFLSSTEVAREPSRKNKRVSQASTGFTGPKTYSQIKEEKNKGGKTADRNSRRMESGEFEGPKPLSEILKDKKRLSSVIETNIDGAK